MIIRVALLVALFNVACYGQEKPFDFVLDHSKPWVYLRLDHIGPRKPEFDDDGDIGIYLRLVNNCRLPIQVYAVGHSSGNPGELLLDRVVPIEHAGITITSEIPLDDGKGQPELPKPPPGYWGRVADVLQDRTVSPGKELLFSVPRNHVSEYWSMQLAVYLDVGNSSGPTGPPTYLEFTEGELPKPAPAKSKTTPNR